MSATFTAFAAFEQARRSTVLGNLSPTSMALISGLILIWQDGSRPTVLQAMHADHGLSSSTVHRHLKALRQSGMILVTSDEADIRVKYVLPSPSLLCALDTMGQMLAQQEVA